MDTTAEQVHEQKPKSEGSSLWKRIKTALLLASVLGLLSANIATLVSDSLHTAAFNTLKSILGHAFADTALTRILSQSPTVKRKELEEKHARKAEAVQKTSKRVAKRSVVGAARNIASLPGQAIPILGTTLIVAVAVWDIYDLCENIKDINELNDVFEHQLEDQNVVCGTEVPTKEQVITDARENLQKAYKDAKYQIEQSHKNAKEQAILKGDDLGEWIDEINTRIQIPPLTEIWKPDINKIYDLFGKFTQ